jgi:hypothetical protein
MECQDCYCVSCICESDYIRKGILTTVLDLMHDKVLSYRDLMQNRVYIIKEDIISTISEETQKFQSIINSTISKLDDLAEEMEGKDEDQFLTSKIADAMTYNLNLNLDGDYIQDGFNQALLGDFIVFRELLKKNYKNEVNIN